MALDHPSVEPPDEPGGRHARDSEQDPSHADPPAKRRGRMSPKALAARRAQVVGMAAGGATMREIGGALGISKSQAHRDFDAGLAELRDATIETAATHRQLQSARIERLIRARWQSAVGRTRDGRDYLPKSEHGRSATDAMVVLRLLHRQSRIHGSDLPDEIRTRRHMVFLDAHGAGSKAQLSLDQVRRIIADEEAEAAAGGTVADPPAPEPDTDAAHD